MAEANYGNLKLTVGALNVNSFNVSTLGNRNAKTFIKIEGLTRGKNDVVFISDCRLKDKSTEIARLLGLNKNASYKSYFNSNMESRGVAIAIKRQIVHEVIDEFRSVDQNILLLKVKIKGCPLILGSIYGPNENCPEFFRGLKTKLEQWNLPFIIGGDFNTILDGSQRENLDMIGGGRVPNPRNALEINRWINDGFWLDPFRALYPAQQETSYIPFRENRVGVALTGKTRLDFFLTNEQLIDKIQKVKYEDKLSHDFDHKKAVLYLGKTSKRNVTKVYNDSLTHLIAGQLGRCLIYDSLCNHLRDKNEQWSNIIGRILVQINDFYEIEELNYKAGGNDVLWGRINMILENIGNNFDLLPDVDIVLNMVFTCEWRTLYEVVTNNLRNGLLHLQANIKKLKTLKREWLCGRLEVKLWEGIGPI